MHKLLLYCMKAACMYVPMPVSSLWFLLLSENVFDIKIEILLNDSVWCVTLVNTCQIVLGFEIICEFLFEKDLLFKAREILD